MLDQNSILLLTKLHRPPIIGSLIDRQPLFDLLDRAINSPLTLVCAPAGFGKTTLVCAWLERMAAGQHGKEASLPSAWLSLDENDSDLNLFLNFFIAALRTVFPDCCEGTLTLIRSRSITPPPYLYATLSNELEKLSQDFILVMDDYHTLHGTEVHDLLNEWARHWPEPLHLVLISRMNPPIPLNRLRAQEMVCEIRSSDLRFTTEETKLFLDQVHSVYLSDPAINILEERFEGWPAGLHLAALSLHSEVRKDMIVNDLAKENANTTGYLMDEVFAHQFPAVHSFLLKTSILGRFCIELCEAVIGETDQAWNVQACLDWVIRSELFITALDHKQQWYRFHPIFKELLQKRLSAEMTADQVASLHQQASIWFEHQGLIEEAIKHSLKGGHFNIGMRQMTAALCDLLNQIDQPSIRRWLDLIPQEVVQQRPEFLLLQVWSYQFEWRPKMQEQKIHQVEALLTSEVASSYPEDELRILQGQILTVKAQLAYFSNQTGKAADFCREALALLPPTWLYVRAGAYFYLGKALQANGLAGEAERILLSEYESYPIKTDSFGLTLLLGLCFIFLNSTQVVRTRQVAQVLILRSIEGGFSQRRNWGEWFLGVVDFDQDRLEMAEGHFEQIIRNRYNVHMTVYRDAVAGLVLIYQTRGETNKATKLLESIRQADMELLGEEDMRTSSLHAHVLLIQGDVKGAGRWADSLHGLPPDQPLIWLEEPQVTRVLILLVRRTTSDLILVQQILNQLEEIVERTHNARFKIVVEAQRALAQEIQGETGLAESTLQHAIDLGKLAGYMRIFVDLGMPMQRMLTRLEAQNSMNEFVRDILAAFPGTESNPVDQVNPTLPVLKTNSARQKLIEPLTPREREILNLMKEPSSLKGISSKLNISYATVKRHSINIYAKLGVNKRWDAIQRAEEFGILPPR